MRVLILSVIPAILAAQQMPPTRPDVRGIFPHGGERGTAVDVVLRGANLQNAAEIRFADPKIKAEIKEVAHNAIKAHITIGASTEPGRHDLRVIAPHGSTIAWFEVSSRRESFEKEPNDDAKHAEVMEFPALVNGVIRPGDYDCYKFTAKAGQTLTFDISAKRNESAVDSVLDLVDEKGQVIAYNDDFYWFKDPHIVHKFERAGTYVLRVYGSGESGSENGDYRLRAGEMPQIDYALPTGGQRGKTQEIRLAGVNLGSIGEVVLGDGIAKGEVIAKSDHMATVRLTIPDGAPLGLQRLHVANAALPVPFVISDLPQLVTTTAAAKSKRDPIPLTVPAVANGVIDTQGKGHYYSFQIDEPQNVLLSVDSLLLDTHLDPIVVLYDQSGKRIAYQDDPTPTNSAKRPANVDPHLVVKLEPGRYTAWVRDNAYRGDPTFAYRFTVKRAEPNFTAGIVGSDETLFRGRETILTVRVRRVEGWNVPVEILAESLPPGVTAPGKVIVPVEPTHYKGTCAEDNILDGTEVEFPLTVAADAPLALSKIKLRARGVMEGRTVEHPVIANYWWKNLQKIWGTAQTPELYATTFDRPELIFDAPDRVAARPSNQGTVKLVVTRLDGGSAPLEIHASSSPAGVSVESVTVAAGTTLAEVKVTASAEMPGSIVLEGVSAGKVLGRSHPILVDTAARAAAPQVISDDN